MVMNTKRDFTLAKYKELLKGWNDLKAAMITNLISKVKIGIGEVNNGILLSSAVKADLDD